MTNIEILQKYDEAISSFAAGLAAGLLDPDQEKSFKEQYELFKAGRDALRRIAEDDKAGEEGRLVELPCKVGDAVFRCCYKYVEELKIVSQVRIGCGAEDEDGRVDFLDWNDFGKTVFLTRQEAEAALGGE